ncbi:uncharacterized protein LOC120371256 [Mauremys reevesii]|uniref:uncharacterized protein LOC120371256 n=1 Tax=Mauremys reevesii TaxID=260615 RepID=UPI00193EC45C|nr:uncharacterized protein LOC120371256 [Mauremys reevesii]XP_039342779.1 uncharacterized protein LOC120371256 [Mauremys reevesii]XP_039342780.1 uncharacterized protein LOC120371256 [Mauremys reevesii]XP_039342781.1 uncharacterized protein LOC120371256 [Mauremys reevesii]XP_039342782.1 uncharacterized protein LOC120371256 [Mauremys reevesii]
MGLHCSGHRGLSDCEDNFENRNQTSAKTGLPSTSASSLKKSSENVMNEVHRYLELAPGASREPRQLPLVLWNFGVEWLSVWCGDQLLRALERSFNAFMQFQDEEGQSAIWPITEEHVLQYMLSLTNHQLASSTILNCLSAITFISRLNGYPDPCSVFLVQRFLAGWSRTGGPVVDSRCPIMVYILKDLVQILGDVCHNGQEAALFRAAFLIAVFGAFRISELVPGFSRDSTGRALQLRDIQWHEHSMILHL